MQKKTQTTRNTNDLTDKLQEIPKIPANQNIANNKIDFPMNEQLISNSETEAYT